MTLRSTIDADVRNRNVERYRDLADEHLELFDASTSAGIHSVRVRTNQSRIEVVVGTRHRIWYADAELAPERSPIAEARAVASVDKIILWGGESTS